MPEVPEAFSSMEPEKFKEKYGFSRPNQDIGDQMVITCRSGRRVGLAITELEKIGFNGLRLRDSCLEMFRCIYVLRNSIAGLTKGVYLIGRQRKDL